MNSFEMIGWHKTAQKKAIQILEGRGYKHVINGCFAISHVKDQEVFYYHACGWSNPAIFNIQSLKIHDFEDLIHKIEEKEDKSGECVNCKEKVERNIFTGMKLVGYKL